MTATTGLPTLDKFIVRDEGEQLQEEAPRAKQAFDEYLRTLPTELAEKLKQTNSRIISSYMSKGNTDPALAAFIQPLRTTKASDILEEIFPPVPFIIPEYLPPGLAFISGKPKIGKSWLVLQLALSVATGGKSLGKDVRQGRVLYLALEDSKRRLQDRMNKQGWTRDAARQVDFYLFDEFHEEIGALNAGGGKRLLAHIESQKYGLVIVDTFSRAFRGDQLKTDEMTDAISPVQSHAVNSNYAFLVVDHMPKNTGQGTDPILHIYGATGKAGVIDTGWGLYKEQGKHGAKLHVVGRETEEKILQLSFSHDGFYWQCDGDAYEIQITESKREILEALQEMGKVTASDIAKALSKDLSNILKSLHDLCNSGLVHKEGKRFSLTLDRQEGIQIEMGV
ncbi:MAG: AAA family ATPase [Chloroflexi bacterium]|nr:AAA family ATPase [Chloroflexota bacterium]